jgi:hypothetical protein
MAAKIHGFGLSSRGGGGGRGGFKKRHVSAMIWAVYDPHLEAKILKKWEKMSKMLTNMSK